MHLTIDIGSGGYVLSLSETCLRLETQDINAAVFVRDLCKAAGVRVEEPGASHGGPTLFEEPKGA